MSLEAAALLQGSHTVTWKVETLVGGSVTYSAQNRFMHDGTVKGDLGASVRRELACRLYDPYYEISPFIDIYGQELRLYRGVVLSSGLPELWPIGTFAVTDMQNLRDPTPSLILRGQDRAFTVGAHRFADVYLIPAGTNIGAAIQELISFVVPWMPFAPHDFSTMTTATCPAAVFRSDTDPWTEALKLSQAAGLDLFFDPMGVCTLRQVPSVSTSPVSWSYIDGQSNTAVQMGARGVATEAFSGSIVEAESSSVNPLLAIPRAVVWDTDTTSPTYYLGPFGKRPNYIRSPLVQTQAQAVAMATADMRFRSGRAKRLEFYAVPNPALDPGDIIHVASANTLPPVDELHVLENFTMPLDATATMTAGSRRRTMA